MLSINFVPIILAAVAAFVVGFLMHGPVAGKLWMRLANIVPTGKEKFSDMVPQMIWNLIANFFTALVVYLFLGLALSVLAGTVLSISAGIVLVLWVFAVAGSSMEVIWMGRKMKLWLFECFCTLLTLATIAAVIVLW